MQLNVPVHQTITLPDEWQACKTPQELSYWLIGKLDGIQADIDAVSKAINEFPELKAQFSALNDTVNAMNSDIDSLKASVQDNIDSVKASVQENAENLSGAEDRIAANSASIAELKEKGSWCIKRVNVFSVLSGNTLSVRFDYFSATDTVPSSFREMFLDMQSNPHAPKVDVMATGVYLSDSGQGVVTGYKIVSDTIQFRYTVASTNNNVALSSYTTPSDLNIIVQPL